MLSNIAIIVKTENNPSNDWESEVKGKLGESISPNHQHIDHIIFDDFNDLTTQMESLDLSSMFIMIPLLGLSASQELSIKRMISEHNAGEKEHFITDVVMLLADIHDFNRYA